MGTRWSNLLKQVQIYMNMSYKHKATFYSIIQAELSDKFSFNFFK